jgi:phage gpG-like protein
MKFSRPQELADTLKQVVAQSLPALYSKVLTEVALEAREVAAEELIGRVTPFPGNQGFPAWKPLQPETIEAKAKAGLGKGGDPRSMLYATGALAESVTYEVSLQRKTAIIGSNLDYAEVHEYGAPAKNIPPRPFLGPAMLRTVERLHPKMQGWFNKTLNSQGVS